MSMPPSAPPTFDDQTPAPKISGLALAAFILGFVALIPLAGIPFGIAAIICGIMALINFGKPAYVRYGKGFAITGIIMSALGVLISPVIFLLIAILLPSLGKARELANRAYCAANLRGIAQSMIVYSNENSDAYPSVPFAPYSSANAGTAATLGTSDVKTSLESLYAPSAPNNGSPLVGPWILVLRDQTVPKQYLCKSDPAVTSRSSQLTNPSGQFYTNFQADSQISYSFAYPYSENGAVGGWWKNTTDASLPIAADMAPLNGTGRPTRNVAPGSVPANPKSWNSGNHQGDGQNVVFADAHVEFSRRPDVGQSNDNIYTSSSTDPVSEFDGTQPSKAPIKIFNKDTIPFDIILVPTRNLDTGSL